MTSLDSQIAQRLESSNMTVSVAESCTGGLLGAHLTRRAGSSNYFRGGIIAYANGVKTQCLGVPSVVLRQQGAVSAPVATRMAEGVRRRLRTTLGVGITGVAGPGGGTSRKPVGLVFIAVAHPHETVVRRYRFAGTRSMIRKQAVQEALLLLRQAIDNCLS